MWSDLTNFKISDSRYYECKNTNRKIQRTEVEFKNSKIHKVLTLLYSFRNCYVSYDENNTLFYCFINIHKISKSYVLFIKR